MSATSQFGRPVWLLAAAGWLFGVYLLIIGWNAPGSAVHFEPSVTFWAQSADAAGSEQGPTEKVEEIAEAKLAETLGSAHEVAAADGSRVVTPPYLVDGHSVRLSDLQRLRLQKHTGVQELTIAGHTQRFAHASDGWVGEWSRDAVTVPGWDSPATIHLLVIVEDGTWKLLTANAGVSNPSAQPATPDNTPMKERCEPAPGLSADARLCFSYPAQ